MNKQREYYLINPSEFSQQDLSFVGDPANKDVCSMIFPNYAYSQTKKSTPLVLQTPFYTLESVPKVRQVMEPNRQRVTIGIDPNYSQYDKLVQTLTEYDDKLKDYVESSFGEGFKMQKRLVSNRAAFYGDQNLYNKVQLGAELSPLDFRLRLKDGQITSEVYNYNISKKYPKVEKITGIEDLKKRVLKKDKQMRLNIRPMSWIRKSGKTYGSFLVADVVEVRYNDAKIASVVDDRTKVVYEEMGPISI